MAEKQAPEYAAIKLEPTAPRRRGRTSDLAVELEKLKADPNEWYRVGVFTSKSGASSVTSAIRNNKRVIPAGNFEYITRTTEDGGSVLFAKFTGE